MKWCRINFNNSLVCYYKPLEIELDGGTVYYRLNDNISKESPESFDTQFGIFGNYDHGEFGGCLGKNHYDELSDEEKKATHLLGFVGLGDYYISGNFCDMFDCGDYSYAISNLIHYKEKNDSKVVLVWAYSNHSIVANPPR